MRRLITIWALLLCAVVYAQAQLTMTGVGGAGQVSGDPCAVIPQTNLSHCWGMDNAHVSGATIIDSIGGLNGTANGGVTSTSAPSGATATTARAFDGTGYIELASSPIATLGNAHSVFFWLSITDNSAEGGGGLSQTPINFAVDANNGVRVANDETVPGGLVISFKVATVNIGVQKATVNTIQSGTYLSIGYTWNGVSTIVLYVNGSAVSTTPQTTFGIGTPNDMGARDGAAACAACMTGKLYQVSVYSVAVDATVAAQIAAAK